jgi:hypothetical protein
MAAIALFEPNANYRDFVAFHIEQARNFKQRQTEIVNKTKRKPRSKATLKSRSDGPGAVFALVG